MSRLAPPRRRLSTGPTTRLDPPAPKPSPRQSQRPRSPLTGFEACQLAAFDPEHRECEGLVRRCHLVKEQVLIDQLDLSVEEAWHPDFWLIGCNGVATPHGGHHWLLDHGKLRIDRRDVARLRPGLEARARESKALAFKLEHLYGPLPRLGRAA